MSCSSTATGRRPARRRRDARQLRRRLGHRPRPVRREGRDRPCGERHTAQCRSPTRIRRSPTTSSCLAPGRGRHRDRDRSESRSVHPEGDQRARADHEGRGRAVARTPGRPQQERARHFARGRRGRARRGGRRRRAGCTAGAGSTVSATGFFQGARTRLRFPGCRTPRRVGARAEGRRRAGGAGGALERGVDPRRRAGPGSRASASCVARSRCGPGGRRDPLRARVASRREPARAAAPSPSRSSRDP